MKYRDKRQLEQILLMRKIYAYLLVLKYVQMYNSNGQRVKKIADGRTTYFIFDQSGNMIGEYDESGQVNSDYIYFGSVPISRVDEWWEGMPQPQAPTPVTLTPGDKQLTVSWNANAEPVDGYKVYWGVESGKYTNSIDVGKTMSYTITGLTNGTTYYVSVKAYADIKETYFYHTDHLGTPILMTNGSGTIIWDGELLPFGERDLVKGSITNNIGLPGQYSDVETGLYYNWWRYYNDKFGRYPQKDPTGFKGGINPYIYANANPLRYSDPSGLVVKLCKRDLDTFFDDSQGKDARLHHAFISITGETFGLTTKNKSFTKRCGIEGPGFIDQNLGIDHAAETEGYMNGSCQQVSCENEDNLRSNLLKAKSSPPYYCLKPGGGGGINCQEWASKMVEKYCKCR
ncbi:MAG: RHS repeat-associated core domain-containing protein [Planctomycetota bacterium]